MALEDSLFKKNIPGKYTSWNEHNIDKQQSYSEDSHSDSDNEETEDEFAVKQGPQNRTADVTTTRTCSDPTERCRPGGMKGTLHDHQLNKQEKARQQILENYERQQLFDRATRGATMMPGELSMSGSAIQSRMRSQIQSHVTEEDEEDDYRKKTRAHSSLTESQEVLESPMSFGHVEEVDAIEYIHAIDDTNPKTYVVVHLYEPFITACRTLNQHWDALARSMPHVRFLRLRASTASKTLDSIGLPSIVIYKDGQLQSNLTPVTKDLPESFKAADVCWLLESCGVSNSNVTEQRENLSKSFATYQGSDDFDDDDDDYNDVD
mmetsp:Transcript_7283/g.10306  ORF Transcript_7283/g.10306 Transcript_7283/m.10306 type:complete len:321 (-) Transcript_7283:13-975(-)